MSRGCATTQDITTVTLASSLLLSQMDMPFLLGTYDQIARIGNPW